MPTSPIPKPAPCPLCDDGTPSVARFNECPEDEMQIVVTCEAGHAFTLFAKREGTWRYDHTEIAKGANLC